MNDQQLNNLINLPKFSAKFSSASIVGMKTIGQQQIYQVLVISKKPMTMNVKTHFSFIKSHSISGSNISLEVAIGLSTQLLNPITEISDFLSFCK